MSTPRTALVVDDEEQLLRLMARILERGGHRVLSAANGDEARRLFRAHADEIEIVLLDVLMPDGDGAEALLPEFLSERPGIDVILSSGDALPEALETELERVGGRFLHKPFVPRSLLRMLEPVETDRPDFVAAVGPFESGGA
ncbi:MAG: response regulator [bacterium]|nr:response regulator [bacterium]